MLWQFLKIFRSNCLSCGKVNINNKGYNLNCFEEVQYLGFNGIQNKCERNPQNS